MSKPKVALVNPPGDRNFSRDLYLGTIHEPELCLPPEDLVCLSARLSQASRLLVVDAIAEGHSGAEAQRKIARFAPDFVIFQTSIASYAQDSAFLARLKEALPRARLIGTGDLYREIGEMAFALQPFVDAVLLDFSAADVSAYLEGSCGKPIENLIHRGKDGRPIKGAERHFYGSWALATAPWELFPLRRYRWPFSPKGPCASVLGDFGCPYLCTYCPESALGYKSRAIRELLAEARRLSELGVRGVFLRDQTFAAHRGRALAFLKELEGARLGMAWAAQTRVDAVDDELLGSMKAAGFTTVCYGIDSGQDELLRSAKKNTTRAQAERAVLAARRAGLKAWGVFLIGLPTDTKRTVEATISFARDLPLDHASYRVEAKRFAADYRRDLLVKGLVPPEAMPPDTPTTTSVWQGKLGISNADVQEFYAQAVAG